MGLLSERGAPSWHPASAEMKAACARAAEYCRSQGVDIAELAIQFALANPRVDTTVLGMSSRRHLDMAVHCLEAPIDRELLGQVENILAPIKNKTWTSGKPENN